MPSDKRYTVRNEDEAWAALADALREETEIGSRVPVEFEGWPHFKVRMPVTERSSSITPSMMQGFIELQKAIYRTHALYQYDTADIRFLPDDDKSPFEFDLQVSEGSSNYDIDLQEILTKLALEVASKMEPRHILILALGAALLWAGRTAWQAWLQDRAEKRREENRSAEMRAALEMIGTLSGNETERMRILTSALSRQKKLRTVRDEADRARQEILKGIGNTGDAEVQGISLPRPVAAELVRGARSQSVETRIDGVFQILTVDTTSPDGFRVRLRNDETDEIFTAGLQDALLSDQQRSAIQDAEWNTKLIKAKINASLVGSALINAIIIDAEPVDTPLGGALKERQ